MHILYHSHNRMDHCVCKRCPKGVEKHLKTHSICTFIVKWLTFYMFMLSFGFAIDAAAFKWNFGMCVSFYSPCVEYYAFRYLLQCFYVHFKSLNLLNSVRFCGWTILRNLTKSQVVICHYFRSFFFRL